MAAQEPTVTRWWWIRHAPVVGQDGRLYGSLDVDCDCSDKPSFRNLARRLPTEAAWVVTPLRRTQATAAAIARHHPTGPSKFHIEPLLAEQNFGRWQGLTYDALASDSAEAWQRFCRAPAVETPPDGESFGALTTRVTTAIRRLTHRHAGGDIVCVSHGGPIRAALAHALGTTPEQALSFAVDNCSLTRLDHVAGTDPAQGGAGDSWRIVMVNGTG